METLLDVFLPAPYLLILPTILLFVGVIWYMDKRRPKKRKITTSESITIFGMIGILMIFIIGIVSISVYYNPVHWGYGRISNIHHAVYHQDKILLHDLFHVSSKSSSASYTRLTVLDAKTGTRNYRGMIGKHMELKHTDTDTLWYLGKNGFTVFSLKKMTILSQWTETELKEIPEFKGGFTQKSAFEPVLSIIKRGKEIELTTLDGYVYWFEPFSRQVRLKPQNLPAQTVPQNLPTQKITITIDNGDKKPKPKNDSKMDKPVFMMQPMPNFPLRQTIINLQTKSSIGGQASFIYPTLLHTDYANERIIISHNENTENKPQNLVISAVDFKGNIIWEKRKKDFRCYDMFSLWNAYDFHRSILADKNLILTFGGFIYAIDIQNGKTAWEKRY